MAISKIGVFMVSLTCACLLTCSTSPQGTVKLGVMLPMSAGLQAPLELARTFVNQAGGPCGRPLEFVYVDLATTSTTAAAKTLAADPSVLAVIAMDASNAAFTAAAIFAPASKPMVSPTATSADLGRAYAGTGILWRTLESDIAQTRVLLTVASPSATKKVALLAAATSYGQTFFNWFGFAATELGIPVTSVVQEDLSGADCSAAVEGAVRNGPDVLVVAASSAESVCVVKAVRALAAPPKLLLTDAARAQELLAALGPSANGLIGTSPGPDRASGFEALWLEVQGGFPPAFAANAYDAVLLLSYGLEKSGCHGGTELIQGMRDAVDARGEVTGWDRSGVARTLREIRAGRGPKITGATGPLVFDSQVYTDLTFSTYNIWSVEYGNFVTVGSITTGEGSGQEVSDTAAFRRGASNALQQDLAPGEPVVLAERRGLWALIAAGSRGWDNYRHQADALAMYQLLRRRGVSDDRILLVVADDLASDQKNPSPGEVRNVAGGPDLRAGATVDYRLDDLTANDLMAALAGNQTERTPIALGSTEGDDVLVFLVGHGTTWGLAWDSFREASRGNVSPASLSQAVRSMRASKRYRRMLVAVEMCFGGVMGGPLDSATPSMVLFAGANPNEESFATNYDLSADLWRADQFAYSLSQVGGMSLSLRQAYVTLYGRVPGSHVTMYNSKSFESMDRAMLDEFLSP